MKVALKYWRWIAITGLIAVSAGCDHGPFPERVQLSDPEIQPLLKAMKQVDREALGFSPITTNAQIRLEHASGGAYDAMLHVYGNTSRTIAFRKTESGYRWIFEQESFQGPKWHQTVDGTFRESLLIEYQTERVDGVPTNQLYIRYTGSDTNLTDREFTLAQVRPILQEWRTAPVEPRPPDLPGAGFDPAPFMFVIFMLIAILIGCILALVVGVVCVVLAAALLAAGIVSIAFLVGGLRRSVSDGFRVLFIQLGAVAGMAGGAIATSAYTWFAKAKWDSPFRWITGLAIGLLAGIVFAWLFNNVWSRVALKLASKLQRIN